MYRAEGSYRETWPYVVALPDNPLKASVLAMAVALDWLGFLDAGLGGGT